eukprot:Skav211220  [mRNA]  locus=scaffold934:166946:167968:- [translate_table: standard]
MAQAQDYTTVIGAIQITRGLPNVPQMASFFQQITRNPALRFRQWLSQDMEFIGLNFLAAHRPQYIHSADFMGALMFCSMRDENRAGTCFMGFDTQLPETPAVPVQRAAHPAHLAGGGTPAQATAATEAFFQDTFLGAGDADVISVCLEECSKFVVFLCTHTHTNTTSSRLFLVGGGVPSRLISHRFEYGVPCAYACTGRQLDPDDLAEIGARLFPEFAPSILARPAAPAPRYGWLPIIGINTRMAGEVTRVSGDNENPKVCQHSGLCEAPLPVNSFASSHGHLLSNNGACPSYIARLAGGILIFLVRIILLPYSLSVSKFSGRGEGLTLFIFECCCLHMR